VNDTCHAEWDIILERMIFLWRETDEETCSKKREKCKDEAIDMLKEYFFSLWD